MRELTIVIAVVAAMAWAVSTDGASAVRSRTRQRPSESSARQYLRQYQR